MRAGRDGVVSAIRSASEIPEQRWHALDWCDNCGSQSALRESATLCYMTSITHRELRNNSAEILRRVEAGETLQVTNNGSPAAVIGPAIGSTLDLLIARGQARPARSDATTLERIRKRLAQQDKPSRSSAEIIEDLRGNW